MDKVRKIRQIWERVAENLTEEDAFIPTPPNFRTITLEKLRQEGLLPDLIKAYQEVFGSEDVWGEGAFCSKEGWNRLISIQEYWKREKEGKLTCECGGTFQLCYPKEILEERMARELSSEKSVLAIMEGNEKWKVGGFAWGIVAYFPEIVERTLSNTRYQDRERKSQVAIELSKLKSKLEERGIIDGPILFVDELGVVEEFRKGIQSHFFLLRLMTEWGIAQGTRRFLFWTSPSSPIYRLGLIYGCESIHRTKDRILEFLLHTDFWPGLKVVQHFNEARFRKLLSEVVSEIII